MIAEPVRWYDDDTLNNAEEEEQLEATMPSTSEAADKTLLRSASALSSASTTTVEKVTETLSSKALGVEVEERGGLDSDRSGKSQSQSESHPRTLISGDWDTVSEQPITQTSATISTAETFSFSLDLAAMTEQCVHS